MPSHNFLDASKILSWFPLCSFCMHLITLCGRYSLMDDEVIVAENLIILLNYFFRFGMCSSVKADWFRSMVGSMLLSLLFLSLFLGNYGGFVSPILVVVQCSCQRSLSRLSCSIPPDNDHKINHHRTLL